MHAHSGVRKRKRESERPSNMTHGGVRPQSVSQSFSFLGSWVPVRVYQVRFSGWPGIQTTVAVWLPAIMLGAGVAPQRLSLVSFLRSQTLSEHILMIIVWKGDKAELPRLRFRHDHQVAHGTLFGNSYCPEIHALKIIEVSGSVFWSLPMDSVPIVTDGGKKSRSKMKFLTVVKTSHTI